MSRLISFILAGVLLACAAGAGAQGVSMLNPLPPVYSLLGFVYPPPKVDGWRELATQADAVRLVYAEELANDQINTRADFTAQVFPIDDPSKVPDALTLTRFSMAQRVDEKKQETGTELVAMSQPALLIGDLGAVEYEMDLKVGGEDRFEDYFVALAPDKSQYFAAKMVTKDKDFRSQSYFKPLQDSVTQLKFANAPKPDQTATKDAGGTGSPPDKASEPAKTSTPK